MVNEQIISPSMSWKGYDFGIWWSKNKGFVKGVVSIAIFVVILIKMWLSGSSIELSVASATASCLVVKKALDLIDYGVSDIKA